MTKICLHNAIYFLCSKFKEPLTILIERQIFNWRGEAKGDIIKTYRSNTRIIMCPSNLSKFFFECKLQDIDRVVSRLCLRIVTCPIRKHITRQLKQNIANENYIWNEEQSLLVEVKFNKNSFKKSNAVYIYIYIYIYI